METKIVYNKPVTNQLIEEGEYEFIFEKYEKKISKSSGNKYISIQLRMNKLADKGEKCLFPIISWDTENNYYKTATLFKLLATQKDLPEGKEFENIEEALDYMKGKWLIAYVKKQKDKETGEESNYISYYKPSKLSSESCELNADEDDEIVSLKVSDDPNDLPF